MAPFKHCAVTDDVLGRTECVSPHRTWNRTGRGIRTERGTRSERGMRTKRGQSRSMTAFAYSIVPAVPRRSRVRMPSSRNVLSTAFRMRCATSV